jgi:hypothetical protein
MYYYAVIESGYRETSSYVGEFNLGNTWGLIASLNEYLWYLVLLSNAVDLGLNACLHIKV